MARPAPTPARRRRLRRDEQPAGRVLVTMCLALVLSTLVNADGLVERAGNKPLGAARDRSLALWHPVQDVANVTQIGRLRRLADDIVGNEDRGGELVPMIEPAATQPAATATRPELREPAAGAPLRVYIGGDSIVRDAGDAFLQVAAGSPLFDTELHYENATGLSRPDSYDWPGGLAADMEVHRPDVAFILFGGNDAQPIVAPDGQTYGGPDDEGWRREYARRVGAVMDLLRAEGRLVFWIGLPPMRERGFDARARRMSDIFRREAGVRPWVSYLDTTPTFGDESGNYVERKPDRNGRLVDLRQADGIHLSSPGADRLARAMLDLIDAEIQASRARAAK